MDSQRRMDRSRAGGQAAGLVGLPLEGFRQASKCVESIRTPMGPLAAIRPYRNGDPIVRPLVGL